jgi:hypothetical protein
MKLRTLLAVSLLFSASPAFAAMSSLADLIASGQSLTCEFDKEHEAGTQSGTIYIEGNRMRGDFTMTSADGSFPMHMINDGEWHYMWGGPMGDQGMKTKISAADRAAVGPVQGPDMDEQMNFECDPWTPEPARFELPSNVTFVEQSLGFGGAAADANAGPADMRAVQCAACDNAPPEFQEQCRQTLGC